MGKTRVSNNFFEQTDPTDAVAGAGDATSQHAITKLGFDLLLFCPATGTVVRQVPLRWAAGHDWR